MSFLGKLFLTRFNRTELAILALAVVGIAAEIVLLYSQLHAGVVNVGWVKWWSVGCGTLFWAGITLKAIRVSREMRSAADD